MPLITVAGFQPDSGPASGPVTAVWRSTEHLDVFTTDFYGTVRTNFWERDLPWPGWTAIGTRQMARGARVAAVWRPPMQLDLFATTNKGIVQSTYWEPGSGWRDWEPIATTTLDPGFDHGAPITAVWRDATYTHLDLFGVDKIGRVLTTFWEPYGWQDWVVTAGGQSTQPGVTVAAVWTWTCSPPATTGAC